MPFTDVKTDVTIIAGRMASVLQPMNISISKLFKLLVCNKWNHWLSGETQNTHSYRFHLLFRICTWILEAWQSLPETIMAESFTKTLDGSEDDIFFKDEGQDDSVDDDDDDDIEDDKVIY